MPDTPNQPGLREQRKAETRARIVDAAVSCFAELGFNGASTRDIAAKAGVGQGLISYHFDSKESLWRHAVEDAFQRAQTPTLESTDGMNNQEVQDEIIASIHRYAMHCIESPELAMLIYHEVGQQGERLQWMIQEHFIPAINRLKPMYEEGLSRGLLRPMPFDIFAFSLTGLVSTHFSLNPIYRHISGDDLHDQNTSLGVTQHIANMFLKKPVQLS